MPSLRPSVRALRFLLLFLALAPLACRPGPSTRLLEAEVVAVADGDSLTVLIDGRRQELRLFGIDCPERGQAFSNRARRHTSGLAQGRKVRVEILEHDRYGRAVSSLLLPDGRELNSELLRAGMAWWYRTYAPDRRDYRRLEAEARDARRGLWVEPNPTPPWLWRKSRSRRAAP